MPLRSIATRAAVVSTLVLLLLSPAAAQRLDLPDPRQLAPGVLLYHLDTAGLVDPEGPLSIWLLRLDPRRIELRSVLANDEIVGTETVADIAARHHALAAINAGFFLPNGDPAGVLTIGKRLVSDTRRPRGAVGIGRDAAGVKLTFARLRATASLGIQRGSAKTSIPIDGVDTTRLLGKVMLFTPSYHQDTDTAKGGIEWVVRGSPLRVVNGPNRAGKTKIPADGFVVSYGGATPPAALARLKPGARVTLDISYEPIEGPSEAWSSVQDIVGGAGLLVRDGQDVADWSVEVFTTTFAEIRHPRTLIGTTADGTIWLATVDGRQPQLSVGMTLVELRNLAHRLDLVNALNLDGGGSTTMWVKGEIVNSPSDAAGPRKVSDALLVYTEGGGR
jgi:hypothetical protein